MPEIILWIVIPGNSISCKVPLTDYVSGYPLILPSHFARFFRHCEMAYVQLVP